MKRVIIMNEIIDQIMKVDSAASDVKILHEKMISEKRKEYEKAMEDYKNKVILDAKQKASELYDGIIHQAEQEANLEEEKCKKEALLVETLYLKIEKQILDKIFKDMFLTEG